MEKDDLKRIQFLAEEIYRCRLAIDRATEEIDEIDKKDRCD